MKDITARVVQRSKDSASLKDLERPVQVLVDLCRELYRLTGRIESTARLAKGVRPNLNFVLVQLQDIDQKARRLSMDVDEAVGIE